jgi:hypothetical protein
MFQPSVARRISSARSQPRAAPGRVPGMPEKEIFACTGRGPLGFPFHGIEVWAPAKDERLGWSYAVERDGTRLPLRAWIPRVDSLRGNLAAAKAVLGHLGLTIAPSPFSWARFVATSRRPRSMIHL